MKKKVKTALTVFMLIVAIPLFCRAEENVYLSTAAGGTETASIGDVLTVHKEDVPAENVCVFYVDNEKYGGISDTLTVTAEMLGKTVYAQVTYGNKTVSTNSVKINAEAPTLELSGVAGDYSAYLTWSAKGNGSDIEKYEIKCALSASPDNIISTQTYQKSASSATITGLTGGIEHIISLTAYNAVGSVTSYVKITPNDPDLATITAVKNEIESSNIAIHMNIANTAAAVKDY
ncbi:MAG: fibronectin type III domain-containing protein, partial [Clostridia bacterium]|nr:fibronectin type III domain-containing protein [Clostridia bacterium]